MPVTNAAQMLEVKRTLDGKIVEYPAERLLVETGVRAVLLCRIEQPEVVAGGRITLPGGTLSVGYFWFDRPYNVYHWLYGGQTLVHYINIGRFRSLTDSALVWDDYAVDLIVYPGGNVDVIDEDEVPETVDAATRAFIADATLAVLAERDAIVAAIEDETSALLRPRLRRLRHDSRRS
jgi:predicted RNA-binding protein associated with RNAse of E/G family